MDLMVCQSEHPDLKILSSNADTRDCLRTEYLSDIIRVSKTFLPNCFYLISLSVCCIYTMFINISYGKTHRCCLIL